MIKMVSKLGDKLGIRACVCRGVLRVWGSRIQDSRTDFWAFWRKMVDSTSMRGWCKMGDSIGYPTTRWELQEVGAKELQVVGYSTGVVNIILYIKLYDRYLCAA
jgi:hypothetical protein